MQNESTKSLRVDPYISTHVARIKETSFTRARAEWLVMEPTSTLDARMSLLKLKRASQVTRGQTIFSLSLSLYPDSFFLREECKSSDWEHFRNVFGDKEMRMTMEGGGNCREWGSTKWIWSGGKVCSFFFFRCSTTPLDLFLW